MRTTVHSASGGTRFPLWYGRREGSGEPGQRTDAAPATAPRASWDRTAGIRLVPGNEVRQTGRMHSDPAPALRALNPQLDEIDGTVSVWYGPVGGPARFTRDPQHTHYAASTMKVAVMAAAYRLDQAGALDLDSAVPVHDDFTSVADGTFRNDPDYDNDPEPWTLLGGWASLRWLIRRMIVKSSNLATNLVLEQVGLDPVAGVLTDVGARDSVVARGIEDYSAAQQGVSNLVTAADLAMLLAAIRQGRVAGTEADASMFEVLLAQEQVEDVVRGLPPGTTVAHKNGWVDGIRHSVALVVPSDAPEFVLATCSTSSLDEEGGKKLVAEVAAAAWSDRARDSDG